MVLPRLQLRAAAASERALALAVVTLRPDGFAPTSPRAGAVTVRVRWSEYWTVLPGGCLRRTPDGMTQVVAPRAGTYVVRARWSLRGALGDGAGCPRSAA